MAPTTRRPTGTDEREFDYFNSSFLITPKGEVNAPYKKRRLVIFGEYIRSSAGFRLRGNITPIGGGLRRGGSLAFPHS